jgi:hypothetical protein
MPDDESLVITPKQYLGEVFEVTDLGEATHFLGNVIERSAGSVRVSNPVKVTELLADNCIEGPRTVLTPMDTSFVVTMKPMVEGISGGSGKPLEEGNRYNELIGSVMYMCSTTRPDIYLAVVCCQGFGQNPRQHTGMQEWEYLHISTERKTWGCSTMLIMTC